MVKAKKKLTDAEIDKLSTPAERNAVLIYRSLQDRARDTGMMGETELLVASQVMAVIVKRNERLGLVAKGGSNAKK